MSHAPLGGRGPVSSGATRLPLVRWSAVELADAVRTGRITAHAVASACLARHARLDSAVHAVVDLDPEVVVTAAEEVDRRVAAGEDPGPLAGVPVTVKDNVDVAGEVTAAGSRGVGLHPAAADAPVVARLRAAGAVLFGRSNMDELAMGASTLASARGPTYHPWDAARSPGGSSGGSAAAVASHQVPLAVGTDTGGSIREPASQCGLVGVAPTPGLVPLDGVVPFDPTCDRVGPLARTVADARLALEVMAARPLGAGRSGAVPLRVGLVTELADRTNHAGVLRLLEGAADALALDGAEIVPVSVPGSRRALDDYMVLTSVAALPVMTAHLELGGAGEEVVRRHALAREVLDSGDVAGATARRRELTAQVAAALDACDVLLSPTMPTTAPVLRFVGAGELTDPLAQPYTDCWTVVASLAGIPALSVPGGLSHEDGMPAGVMLAGPAWSDALLLDVAEVVEAGC